MTGPFLISTYHLCRTKFFPFGYSLYFPLRIIHDVRRGTSLASPEIQSPPPPVLIIFTGPCDYQRYNVLPAFTVKSYFQQKSRHKMSLLLITTLYILTPYPWPLVFFYSRFGRCGWPRHKQMQSKKLQSKCPNNVAVGIYTVKLTSIENKKWQKTAFESCNSHAFPLKLTVKMPN